jgi:hypothetical protein
MSADISYKFQIFAEEIGNVGNRMMKIMYESRIGS